MREFIDRLDDHPARKAGAFILLLAGLAALTVPAIAFVRGELDDPTAAGEAARDRAEHWNEFIVDNFDERVTIEQADGEYGTGSGSAEDGKLTLNGLSETSHAVPWVVYPQVPSDTDFYMEVDAQLTRGPSDTGCGLIFAWQNADSWWGVRIVDRSTFLVSRFEGNRNGRIDARTFSGPFEIEGTDIRQGALLAVERVDDTYRFYVNDRLVVDLDDDLLLDPSGSPAPFAIDTSTLYRAAYRCTFGHLRVWTDMS